MNKQIFEDFENLIQCESDFIINNYGQQAFNLCCSVRDWFETCLKHIRPVFADKDCSQLGLNLYVDIVVADIFQDGVRKLIEKFLTKADYENKSATHFFKHRKEENDDKHLKRIRAVFGAHPFDIHSNEGGQKSGNVHYLGDSPQWIGNPSAIISRPNGKTEIFSLNLNELKQFIAHRYSLLACITEKIRSDIASFVEAMKARPIRITDEMSPLEKLNVLYDEAGENKRGKVGSGFQDEVEKLRFMFSCKITSPKNRIMVKAYRKALLPIIEKYRKILQNMSFAEAWEEAPLLEASALGLPDKYNWDIQNLRIKSPKSPIAENCLKNLFHSKFDTTYSSREEFYLLICAYLFTLHGDNEKS